jgi:hypothetical protein
MEFTERLSRRMLKEELDLTPENTRILPVIWLDWKMDIPIMDFHV